VAPQERLDRQLRIEGWDQRALDLAQVGVVGDADLLPSLYVLSAAALGINHLVVIAPWIDARLLDMARKINPHLDLIFLEGYYTHPVLADIFQDCRVMVDLSCYGLANKLLWGQGFQQNLPIIRGLLYDREGEQGLRLFTYRRGREWEELEQVLSPRNLPGAHFDDGVLAILAAALALEETKNALLGQEVSREVISYRRPKLTPGPDAPNIGVVGAGALGNFVGLGLAYAGFRRLTFIDPQEVEATNLNRQVFFYEGVGLSKAALLAERLNQGWGAISRGQVRYFQEDPDLSPYDVIFDCADNFATKIVLSEKCQEQGKVLISGGTSVAAGQVVVYDPSRNEPTPAALLGLYDIVANRQEEEYRRERESCLYQPEPAVIMTNQIIAGLMVEAYRRLWAGQEVANMFYDAGSDQKI